MRSVLAAGCLLAFVMPDPSAEAFCGFYINGSDKKMFNDATNVVLMRAGTRTVLAMQNDYRGPLDDFAMVIPVPVVLKPTDVRVVPKAVFDRLDSLGSPRLVEYWEQDPCPPEYPRELEMARMERRSVRAKMAQMAPSAIDGGGGGGGYEPPKAPARPAVAPVMASFAANPMTVTAGVPTNVTWTFGYANQPWPTPTCTVDHGVGTVYSGAATSVTIDASTTFTVTCANSAGRSSAQVKVNAVKVEAEFDVEEYQIVILSAAEAAGLEDWLKINHYKIPAGAEPLLRPYVEAGSKFFVAKVDPKKVKMVDGHVALSPLRFHYDTEDFSLPIRLGMANSSGKQDLIVNIVSPDKRYEVANYKNVFIPTNINVIPAVKDRFAEFYAALFDKTIEANRGAVVTEYAWTAQPNSGAKCDPCPPVIPMDADMTALGGDVVGGTIQKGGFVLTRLHARYTAADMKDDLRFREASPVVGGREMMNASGAIETGTQPSPMNFFQGRYAIRHWWTGPVKCANPQRQVWGGPPYGAPQAIAATKVAFAPRGGMPLGEVIGRDLWEIGFKRTVAPPPTTKSSPGGTSKGMWIGIGLLAGVLLGAGALTGSRARSDRGASPS